jgi:hypothetical protein
MPAAEIPLVKEPVQVFAGYFFKSQPQFGALPLPNLLAVRYSFSDLKNAHHPHTYAAYSGYGRLSGSLPGQTCPPCRHNKNAQGLYS